MQIGEARFAGERPRLSRTVCSPGKLAPGFWRRCAAAVLPVMRKLGCGL